MGSYAADPTYFAAGWKRNGPLTAKKGVYRYGGGYPTQTWRSANYFSDVSVAVTQATPVPTTTSSTSPTSSTTSTTHDDDHHAHDAPRRPPVYTAAHLESLPGLLRRHANGPRYATTGVPVRRLVAGPDSHV